jgi:hypothetical protein
MNVVFPKVEKPAPLRWSQISSGMVVLHSYDGATARDGQNVYMKMNSGDAVSLKDGFTVRSDVMDEPKRSYEVLSVELMVR